VSLRRLRHRGSHEIVLARAATQPPRDFIVKRPRRHSTEARRESLRRRAEVEYQALTEIAPLISVKDPALGCPRPLGYDPHTGALFLERVDGESLRSIVFGLGGPVRGAGRPARGGRIARALRLSAEWLARLHEVTRSEHERHAFDWVLAELALPETERMLRTYAGEQAYRELERLAIRFRREHPQFRRPLCRIHGAFLPYHVLAGDAGIHVIDLEVSRLGFPHEDTGLFVAYYDLCAPWRRLVADRRMPIEEQVALWWRAYSGSDEPASSPEGLLRGFTRVLGMARFVALARRARYGEDVSVAAGSFAAAAAATPAPATLASFERTGRSLTSRLLEPWWRHRVRLACGQELAAMRDA